MSLKQRLSDLITDLERFSENEASEAIETKTMIAVLKEVRDRSDFQEESRLRRYERRFDLWTQQQLEMTRAVILFGQNAIRALFLANGAAAIALLTFLGALVDRDQPELAKELSVSLWWFSVGVMITAIVAMTSYVVQYLYGRSVGKPSSWGVSFHIVAVGLAVASVASFLVGLSTAYGVFRSL